jgi:hypothetical protein
VNDICNLGLPHRHCCGGNWLRTFSGKTRNNRLRDVIVWATGTVGCHAIRAIHDKPALRLVGCYTYSPAKVGRDAGELAGIAPLGVITTDRRADILAMAADCVLYMPIGEGKVAAVVDDICDLLASGKNVISTALTALIYPRAAGQEVADRLEAACKVGGTSFHATGVQPGWAAEVLPLTLSPLLRKVDSLLVREILDYSTYPSAATLFDDMGFGRPAPDMIRRSLPPEGSGAFGAPLLMLADAWGSTIDEIVFECEFALAQASYDIPAGRIEEGTVAGKRYSFTAMIGGRPAMKIEHVTRVGSHIAPQWPQGRGWYITVEGSPAISLRAEIACDGGDENDQSCLAAAMHAVHAIDPVSEAPPGVRTFLDLPLQSGRGIL